MLRFMSGTIGLAAGELFVRVADLRGGERRQAQPAVNDVLFVSRMG